jgi:O-antigen/teichoic acid export membrane protein
MSKAADMAKASVRGGFHIVWGLLASTIISAVGAIILALVLGENNYGLYAVALTTPTLIGLFQDLGINYAVTRYSARLNTENKTAEIRSIFLSGFIFKTLLGLALSLLCLLLAPYLAVNLFHRPTIVPLIQAVSFIILGQALVNTATAAFTGLEKMHLNSAMVVSQSIIKTILAPALVLLGLGLYGAVIGNTVAYLITALIGILLVGTIYRNLPSLASNKLEIKKNIKVLLRFGLPLSFGDVIGSFLMQFYSFILAIFVANNALIGNYTLASNFTVLITFVAIPINTMLFPAFSKLDADTEQTTLKNVYQASVKYSTLLVMPVIAIMMALAQPGISTIFGHSYSQAPFYLSLLAINYAFLAFGMYSTNNLINSQNQSAIKIVLALVTVAIGVPLGLITIPRYGVLGLLITLIFDGVPTVAIGLIFIKKRYNTSIDWGASGKIILSSAIAAFLSYFVVKLPFPSLIQLIVGLVIFLSVFIVMIILTKTLSSNDMFNLREMTSNLGPLSKIVNTFLNWIEKLQAIFNNNLSEDNPSN